MAATSEALLPGAAERLTITIDDVATDTDFAFEARVDGTAVGAVECDATDNTDAGEERCPGLE